MQQNEIADLLPLQEYPITSEQISADADQTAVTHEEKSAQSLLHLNLAIRMRYCISSASEPKPVLDLNWDVLCNRSLTTVLLNRLAQQSR